MNDSLDWNEAGEVALGIANCTTCAAVATGGPPQPYWIGPQFRPGGAIWLAQNPGSGGLKNPAREQEFRSEFDRFAKSGGSGDAFRRWSVYRIDDLRHWGQDYAFRGVFDGCLEPEEVAWLNVVPVRGDRWRGVLDHAIDAHLRPMLGLLAPRVVVARYRAAADAAQSISGGQWEVCALPGIGASRADRARAKGRLRALGLC